MAARALSIAGGWISGRRLTEGSMLKDSMASEYLTVSMIALGIVVALLI